MKTNTSRDTLTKLAILGIFLITISSSAKADWIKDGIFSANSGIDSLERFLVISDIEDSTLFGWTIVRCSDVNGDNIDDIIVCRTSDPQFKGNHAFLFHGSSTPDANFDKEFLGFSHWFGCVGDVNGDSFNDFGNIILPSTGFELFLGGPAMDDSADFSIPLLNSQIVKALDVDLDNRIELPISVGLAGSDVNLYDISSTRDTFPEYILSDTLSFFGNTISVGDFNGDNITDIAVASVLRNDSNFIKFYWGGLSFDTTADFQIWSSSPRFGRILLPLGDFNYDGYGDIFIAGGANEPYGIYFGGPQIDDQMDIVANIGIFGGYFAISSADVGDFNNDGHPDLLIGHFARIPFINEFYILLGGPNADSLVDVYIRGGDIPGGQSDFGREVRAIGDFNNDGLEDFAVHSLTQLGCCWTAEVNLFAGWQSVGTDVPYEYEETLPDNYSLSNNYPNPFNPSTTIEFSLPRRGYTTLEIFNVLGKKVSTLINNTLSAGSYKVSWDGRDSKGNEVASGVYFYKLETTEFVDTKKMILVR